MTGVDATTLRYWEKEFKHLKPQKSKSGQRIYSGDDLELVLKIKKLLYEEGYTVSGARKKLNSPPAKNAAIDPPEDQNTAPVHANRIRKARQLAREILEILDS